MDPTLAAMRQEYTAHGIAEDDLARDPLEQFRHWFEAARQARVHEPNAMALATVGQGGQPSLRIVLLKGLDERGLAFFTGLASRKARELAANPRAAATFWWGPLERQVRFEGGIERVADEEADAYFASRPRGAQIGAWASEQSAAIAGRASLERAARSHAARFGADPVPRPPHWGGFRLVPHAVEFWQGRQDRLHDRLRYTRAADGWRLERLAP